MAPWVFHGGLRRPLRLSLQTPALTPNTTINSANLGSYGELGSLDFNGSSCKPAIIAYKTSGPGAGDYYITAATEFH